MSGSFGEALVGAFNSTYGTVTAGRLRNEQAAALRQEREGNERHQRAVRESQIRNGLLNPDGTTNDPNANLQRSAALQAPAPSATPAAAPDLGAPTSPAPTPAATGTPAPAPSPAPEPRPGVAAARAGAVAGATAAGAVQAAQPAPAAPAAPAPSPMAGPPAAAPGAAPQAGGPPIPQEVLQEAAERVERNGNNPVDAMIVAGAIAPRADRAPGGQGTQAQAAQYAPQLAQEITQHRGEGQRGPLTQANWNAYLRDVTLSSQANLSPAQQVQALAVVDRIRVAGLQRFTALAAAAAQSGDMEGAARALNGASNFNPDGFQDTFRATQGGIEMTRRPEEGTRGEPQRVTVSAADTVRYATAMLDPQWSLQHYLNVDRHNETVRHNRASEGLQAASIAGAAADRRERREERNAERTGNNEYLRAQETVSEAERALARLPETATAEQRQAARDAVDEARTARTRALANAGERGIRTAATIEAQRRADEDRDAARTRLPEGVQRRYAEAEDNYRETTTPARGQQRDPAQRYALDFGAQVQEMNRNLTGQQILENLEAFRRNGSQYQINRQTNEVRSPSGLTFRVPPNALPPPVPRTGDPAAPRDQGSMGGARTPPSSTPAPSPMAGPPRSVPVPGAARSVGSALGAERERGAAEEAAGAPARAAAATASANRSVDSWASGLRRRGITPTAGEIARVSRQYGIPEAEVRRRFE